jgi:UDP-glucose 4-epimerase
MRNNRCLVVGGNGFLGKNLTLKLLSKKFDVVIYDISKPSCVIDMVEYIEGSIDNTALLVASARNAHAIIWLVHTSVPATSMYDVESDLLSNIPPLIRFVQQLQKDADKKRFIYLSSGGTVYGNASVNSPTDEVAAKDPISSYGLTKFIAEEYLNFFLKRSSVPTFILRPSNVYGPYQNLNTPQGLIGHVFRSLIMNEPITIFGDGSIIRDYLHVADLIEAVLLCLKTTPNSPFPLVLNIGSGRGTSINDILSYASKITGIQASIKKEPERDFDCRYNVLSIEKARKEIGWEPRIELQQGLYDVWNWIKLEIKN